MTFELQDYKLNLTQDIDFFRFLARIFREKIYTSRVKGTKIIIVDFDLKEFKVSKTNAYYPNAIRFTFDLKLENIVYKILAATRKKPELRHRPTLYGNGCLQVPFFVKDRSSFLAKDLEYFRLENNNRFFSRAGTSDVNKIEVTSLTDNRPMIRQAAKKLFEDTRAPFIEYLFEDEATISSSKWFEVFVSFLTEMKTSFRVDEIRRRGSGFKPYKSKRVIIEDMYLNAFAYQGSLIIKLEGVERAFFAGSNKSLFSLSAFLPFSEIKKATIQFLQLLLGKSFKKSTI